MGTRSTTKIYRDAELVLALYKQFDGYPDGWGQELKDFLKSGKFVNGIPGGQEKVFNGIGDFALQLVVKFKDGPGSLYATTMDDSQEYNYEIRLDSKKGRVILTCLEEKSFIEMIDVGNIYYT